jgi:hypothetical protein
VLVLNEEALQRQRTFFLYLFRDATGFLCLARLNRDKEEAKGGWKEEFFRFPDQLNEAINFVAKYASSNDIYFCPQLLNQKRRTKDTVVECSVAWADLDTCHPSVLLLEPTITVESSPGRYQAYWAFNELQDPADAEDVSRRIAYKHHAEGADKTGWDLTQLLRVPFTGNHKYRTETGLPVVNVIGTRDGTYTLEHMLEVYPPVKQFAYAAIEMPDDRTFDQMGDAESILERHRARIVPVAFHLFAEEPDAGDDWSKRLWQLEMTLFEAGLVREEVFIVADASKCNKYKRDGRPKMLWKEVCRAFSTYERNHNIVPVGSNKFEALLSDEDHKAAANVPTFVEQYIKWGKEQGDAAWQYHQAGGFLTLSTLLSGRVRLPTSFGTMVPNLWFMILADTTLTRKTTAMDLTMDLIADIDQDAVLATDGSIEGLFTSLSMRPGRPSIFLRDEFSGLIEAITKKDYYAGMAETLTKLYDGKFQKRVLRKDVIEVRDPVLLLFAGGIKSRTLSLLTHEQVASGFLPRFVFITAESDLNKRRPLGPPTQQSLGDRQLLVDRATTIFQHYNTETHIQIGGVNVSEPTHWDATLTNEAWMQYNVFEEAMLQAALQSTNPEVLMPMFDRLSKSGLKAAVLIAASRRLEDRIVVSLQDLMVAFHYVDVWREYSLEVVNGIGRTVQERQIQAVFTKIQGSPGISRSEVIRTYHLGAREMGAIIDTLEQRAMITTSKNGRAQTLYPTMGD